MGREGKRVKELRTMGCRGCWDGTGTEERKRKDRIGKIDNERED